MKAGDISSSSGLAERFGGPIQADHTWTMIFMGHMKNEVSLLFIALLLDVPSLQVSWRSCPSIFWHSIGLLLLSCRITRVVIRVCSKSALCFASLTFVCIKGTTIINRKSLYLQISMGRRVDFCEY